MDEMRIQSKLMTGMISKIVRSVLCKKTGIDIDICLNDIRVTVTDGKVKAHLDANATMSVEDLTKLTGFAGLT